MQNYGQNISPYNMNPFYQPQPYQELLGLAASLQEIVLKQQAVIDSLAIKQQQLEEQLQNISSTQEQSTWAIKLEPNEDSFDQKESEPEALEAPDNVDHTEKRSNIRRRNGFKTSKRAKKEKENSWDSENESLSGSDKPHTERRNPSKAKHLWVSYGRRIIEYGINQTKGPAQERIRQLTGKLNSKKDFKDIFEITGEESMEDRQFKSSVGNMAIEFVKNKAMASFEGAKHKQQMIEQRHIVAAWIESLISAQ